MEISGSSVAANASASIAAKVKNQTEDLQKENAQKLIESVPDPLSAVGQNVNVKV